MADLLKMVGTNGVEHWINPVQINRLTYTKSETIPGKTITTPGTPATPFEQGTPTTITTEPDTIIPPSVIIHLDTGFSIEVANSPDDIAEIVAKINAVL